MAIRSARSGRTVARWAYGVLVALCVALAVLVHHETPSMDVSSMQSMQSMQSTPDPVHAVHVMPDGTPPSSAPTEARVSGAAAHGAGDGACDMPGMQHCTSANVGPVQLAGPDQIASDPLVNLRHTAAGRTPGAAVVGRAPPDLSVLSRLRV
ncbi:hypothetical protein [Streptomyces cellulosae]|uniref:hypothetical protein n=1 Tax=Streptomyces cellulosae TaxID=1968 RepID=UPI0004C56207|nr:hypothetical protein [Streptomyces cellulosae]